MNTAHERKRSLGPEASLTFSLQALLLRHEEFAANAEEARSRLSVTIKVLEESNREFKGTNTLLVEENIVLRIRVDDLGVAVAEADKHNEALTATLESTKDEIMKLGVLASRTEHLETQLKALEAQTTSLQAALNKSQEQECAVTQRWRVTQDEVACLQPDLSGLRVTNSDIRMKQGEALLEFDVAQTSDETRDNEGRVYQRTPTVSSFVKGILQDNANLQLVMAGQQDTLHCLQEEIEGLREKFTSAPLPLSNITTGGRLSRQTSLEKENLLEVPMAKTPQVHVHHHYHGPPPKPPTTLLARSKSQTHARSRKRKLIIPSSTRQNDANTNATCPLQQISHNIRQPSISSMMTAPSPTPLPHHSLAISSSINRRPSRPLTSSSNPSSPYSPIFERPAFGVMESDCSRPTSRGSSVVWTPELYQDEQEKAHDEMHRQNIGRKPWPRARSNSYNLLDCALRSWKEETETSTPSDSGIWEMSKEDLTQSISDTPATVIPYRPPPHPAPPSSKSRSLHNLSRTPSTASLLSISGMDILTTHPRTSPNHFPLNFTYNKSSKAHSRSNSSSRTSSSKPPTTKFFHSSLTTTSGMAVAISTRTTTPSPAVLTEVEVLAIATSSALPISRVPNFGVAKGRWAMGRSISSSAGLGTKLGLENRNCGEKALSRSLLRGGRSISADAVSASMANGAVHRDEMAVFGEREKGKEGERVREKVGKTYHPITDTFGGKLGSWLSGRVRRGFSESAIEEESAEGQRRCDVEEIVVDEDALKECLDALSSSGEESCDEGEGVPSAELDVEGSKDGREDEADEEDEEDEEDGEDDEEDDEDDEDDEDNDNEQYDDNDVEDVEGKETSSPNNQEPSHPTTTVSPAITFPIPSTEQEEDFVIRVCEEEREAMGHVHRKDGNVLVDVEALRECLVEDVVEPMDVSAIA